MAIPGMKKTETTETTAVAETTSNPAIDALTARAQRKAERKAAKKAARKEARLAAKKAFFEGATPIMLADTNATPESETQAVVLQTKALARSAISAFIDNEVKNVANAFVQLFMSRPDGNSDTSVLALDAVIVAFDACGLILSDVGLLKPQPAVIDTGKSTLVAKEPKVEVKESTNEKTCEICDKAKAQKKSPKVHDCAVHGPQYDAKAAKLKK